MPRNTSGIYTVPVGTDGVANTTIVSAKYNNYIHDVETDLNTPRPIVAGGTGASDATSALIALGGEKASQQVTNYDTFAFVAGSFWSAAGATSAPTSTSRYSGICIILNDGSGDMVIEAANPGAPITKYRRVKLGGSWGVWTVLAGSTADLDAVYVNAAGDTMTGNLYITPPTGSAYLHLQAPAALTGQAMVNMYDNGVSKWQLGKQVDNSFLIYDIVAGLSKISIGNGTGPGTGVNLNGGAGGITLTSTGGALNYIYGPTQFNVPLAVTAAGLNMQFGGSSPMGFYSDAGNIALRCPAGGTIYFQDASGANIYGTMTKTLLNAYGSIAANGNISATASISCNGLTVAGDIIAGNSNANQGVFRFGNNGQAYIYCDGGHYNFGTFPIFSSTVDCGNIGIPGGGAALRVGHDSSWYGSIFQSNGGVSYPCLFNNTGGTPAGSIQNNNTSVAYQTSSDVRLKEDLKSFDAGRIIDDTEVYNFKWKATDERSYGVSAQQAVEVFPQAVGYNEKDDWWGIDYSKYVPILLQELKTLRARVAALEALETPEAPSQKGSKNAPTPKVR